MQTNWKWKINRTNSKRLTWIYFFPVLCFPFCEQLVYDSQFLMIRCLINSILNLIRQLCCRLLSLDDGVSRWSSWIIVVIESNLLVILHTLNTLYQQRISGCKSMGTLKNKWTCWKYMVMYWYSTLKRKNTHIKKRTWC